MKGLGRFAEIETIDVGRDLVSSWQVSFVSPSNRKYATAVSTLSSLKDSENASTKIADARVGITTMRKAAEESRRSV